MLLSTFSYICGTIDHDLRLFTQSPVYLTVTTYPTTYSDDDWARYPTTRCFIFGNSIFLGYNMLSWLSKIQGTISQLSVEAKYNGVANVVTETS